jgi:hypothetical protein
MPPRSREASRFPPVFSSPAAPGWNGNRFGFDPGLRTPQSPTEHAEAETGPRALARVLHLRHQPNLQSVPRTSLMHPHVAHNLTWIRSPHRRPAQRADARATPGSRWWSTPTCSPSSTCRVGPDPAPGCMPWRLSSRHQVPRTADESLPRLLTPFCPDLLSWSVFRGERNKHRSLTRVLTGNNPRPPHNHGVPSQSQAARRAHQQHRRNGIHRNTR